MADIPTPRSYNQILGDMVAAFLARYPIHDLKIGSPILSILEASAQSDLRNTADIFKFLASVNLDSAEGTALDKILADEGTQRIGASPSSGLVTIGDSRFTKKSTTVYHATPAPLVGTTTVNVTNASGWATTGFLYIGRGTDNYEGPIAFNNIVYNGTYYVITLTTPTTRFHQLGESVILGTVYGTRIVSAGSVCSTADGNGEPKTFSVLYDYTILDGEDSLSGIQVVCTQPGTVGNVAVNSIVTFASPPFTGATVTNPLPYTNGYDVESDEQARTRVRLLRKSKAKGTASAIEAYLVGVQSEEESKRITSVSVVDRQGYPTTTYIDDGTGYEEKASGVSYEVLTNSAVGGEQYFQLALGRPIAKAYVTSTASEPFNITNLSALTVRVGGIESTHQFLDTDFRFPTNAAAYEVVHSINAASDLLFSARTASNGTQVVIFAKAEENESVEVVEPSGMTDANLILKFPGGRVDTVKLYKNDLLLFKDGVAATVEGNPQSSWAVLASGDTIDVDVDGTGSVTYTIVDADFINAGTQYNSVSSNNSLESWAAVFNYKIAGVTTTVIGNRLQMQSNAGPVARGSLTISGSAPYLSVIAGTSTATVRDYTLNRNTGQLRLEQPLVAGDFLAAGTPYNQAFIESDYIAGTITVAGTSGFGEMWFVVDPKASDSTYSSRITPIVLPLVGTVTFTETAVSLAPNGPDVNQLAASDDVFVDVQLGDWVILTDTAFANPGAYRVSHKVGNDEVWLSMDAPANNLVAFTLNEGGLAAIRTTAPIQKVSIPNGIYTAQGLATQMNTIEGAHGEVVRTGHFRVVADSRGPSASIAYVIGNDGTSQIPLARTIAYADVSSRAYVESGNPENDVPYFYPVVCSANDTTTSATVTIGTLPTQPKNVLLSGLRSLVYTVANDGVSNPLGFVSSISDYVAPTFTVREAMSSAWLFKDRLFMAHPYCITPDSDLSVVLDGDINLKRFEIPLYRRVAVSGTYGAAGFTITESNADPLGDNFGSSFSFNDYAVFMHPRVVSHPIDADRQLLWRWSGLGAGGEGVSLKYAYPNVPDSALGWTISYSDGSPRLDISLPSGNEIALSNLNNTMRIASRIMTAGGAPNRVRFYAALKIISWAVAGNVATILVDVPEATGAPALITDHGLAAGNIVYVGLSGQAIPAQLATITGVANGLGSCTFTYNLITPDNANGPDWNGLGYVYFDTGNAHDFTPLWTDDVLHFTNTWGVPGLDTSMYVSSVDPGLGNLVVEAIIPDDTLTPSDDLTWSNVLIAGAIVAFPLTDIANTSIAAASATWPAVATAQAAGAVVAWQPTWLQEDDMQADPWIFEDGLNFVKTTTPAASPANYSITLKQTTSANLANPPYAGWADEEVYLAPLTVDNLRDFINSTGVSGISQNAEVVSSSRGGKLQIMTNTQGTSGSVEVLGGLASTVSATVVGNAQEGTPSVNSYVLVPRSEVSGFQAGWPVLVQNVLPENKQRTFKWYEDILSITSATKTFLFDQAIGDYASAATVSWQFEKQGRFMAMVWNKNGTDPTTAITNLDGGGYIHVSGGTASSGNLGLFPVVASYHSGTDVICWIDNPNGVEERATASISTATRDSVVPGDTITINSTNWGTGNRGTFTIQTVNYTTAKSFTTVETPVDNGAYVAADPLIVLTAGTPLKLYNILGKILPDNSANYSVFIFNNAPYLGISETYGAKVTALSKLEFPSTIGKGKDGYDYNTGLIGEANRVLYGLESDPVTYPGVIAAGASVNIAGPVVRRIQVSLALRIRNGANKQATFDAVRSAVTTYVNSLGIGQPIAISQIVSVAGAIGGVEAVSVANPTYGTSSDQIAVQPYEKPMVLQSELDITLTLVA